MEETALGDSIVNRQKYSRAGLDEKSTKQTMVFRCFYTRGTHKFN